MINFLPLGGAGEIGANCFYLNIAGTGIIMDCGMHPQKIGTEALPDFDLVNDLPLDFVLISHAHQDHLSALPFLVQKYPHVRIITTPQTRALAELTLHDAVSIWKQQIVGNDSNNPNDISKSLFRIYSHEEIDLLIQSIEYNAYRKEFFLKGYNHKSSENIRVTFFDAGHILGSAGILIEFSDHKIFYSGDINFSSQELLTGAVLPETKINTIITETTYGSTDSSVLRNWKDEKNIFATESNKVLNKGGSILIPVFSLGKTQEILALIWDLILKGKLIDTDIYTGGIGRKISRVYDYNRFVVNYSNNSLELDSVPQKNIYEVEDHNDFFKMPSLILAPSGMMLEQTISYKLGIKWLSQPESAIFTVGFMEKKTPGFRFANSKKGDKIDITGYRNPFDVNCSVKNFRFTAHSKREELLGLINRLKAKNVILVHGDVSSIDWVGENLLKQNKLIKVYAARKGKEIIIE